MELSLTTFILETINFLVLIWILKRLFFAPIRRVIEERRAAIQKTVNEAQTTKSQAEQLRTQFEGRLKAWEQEKAQAESELEKSLTEEKARRLREIESSLAAEREKVRAQEAKVLGEQRERLERDAMKQAMEFTRRLLEGLASPELEAKIIEMVLAQACGLGAVAVEGDILVRSGFDLSEEQKNRICKVVQGELGGKAQIRFSIEKSLIAGLEVVLGANVIRANLRDELAYFSEARS